MATSANFGNKFSTVGVSLFLPLLPRQILLANLLTDFSAMTIATDGVDEEATAVAKRWDIHFIRNIMLVFGFLSSVFDYLTFAVLHWRFRADMIAFRTGLFVESVCPATLIVLVIRTRRAFLTSRTLLHTSLTVVAATLLLRFTPIASTLEFARQTMLFTTTLLVILSLNMAAAELTRLLFYSSVLSVARNWRLPFST